MEVSLRHVNSVINASPIASAPSLSQVHPQSETPPLLGAADIVELESLARSVPRPSVARVYPKVP